MTNRGKGKGKEVAGKGSSGKRKITADNDKTGGGKRRNRGVVQFFEESADVDDFDDSSDDSDFSDDYFGDEEFETLSTMNKEPAKGQSSSFPFVPKEEEIDEEEFDRMMEARYGEASTFIRFAGDDLDDKGIDPNSFGVKEFVPTIWKVKCMVGRERISAFCLMQKFADLKLLGTKLEIISAFAVDHMKGFVYIEAERQCDINQACNGITGIYVTRVQPVPRNEVFHLFSVRPRSNEIAVGTWARVKSGHYKGDIAQVVAVNNTIKKVTVKLIPRIDLQALAAKFGGGYSRQKTAAVPAPRLISSSELEEFRPLIQIRRDRDTGKVFEVLDGMLLKDGYVYKKVSPDSLNLWGVEPTEEELLKFVPSENNESKDLDWLSQLYGDSKKKRVIRDDKGSGKGESSSGSGVANGFELYDLVCFGKKDFGLIVGMDKDDGYKILKEGPDGPVGVNVQRRDIKCGLVDLKLSAQDQHNKTILVNDNVRVLEGPSKGKEGIVRHIYRGIIFLYNETEEDNGGYFTSKSKMCEKVKLTIGDFSGKDSEPGPLVFEDIPTSPRSPLSPKKPWQARENNREFNRGDQDSLFTIGQTLRIRIGPLKGYLCRVIAIRRTDVTVKLDSQQKVLTVKCEHLSEVQGKGTAVSRGDPDPSSSKPFDLLGTDGNSGGWLDGAGTSTGGGGWNAGGTSTGGGGGWNAGGTSTGGGDGWNAGGTSTGGGSGWNAGGTSTGGGDGWNAGGTSTERSTWSNHSAPSTLETVNPISSTGLEDSAWETKKTSNPSLSWGAVVGNKATDDLDGNQPSGGDSKSNWNTPKASEDESSGWNQKSDEHSKDVEQNGQGNGWKNGSSGGGNNWNAPVSSSQVNSEWTKKSTKVDKEEKGKDQGGWGAGKASDGSATGSGWKGGSGDGVNTNSAWETKKSSSSSSGWNSGSSDGAKEGSNWGNMKSGSVAENQNSDWEKASNSNYVSGDAGILGKGPVKDSSKDGWKSGSADGMKQTSNWGALKSGSGGNEKQKSNWSSDLNQTSNWGKNNNSSSGAAANENNISNWSAVDTGTGNQDSSWGKKNQDTDQNNSNWNSGSASNSNQNSNWGKKENLSESAGAGCTDTGNQDSGWGKKSNWNSGNSGSQASDLNKSKWNSGSDDSNKNSNWSSGNQDSSLGKKSTWNSGSDDTDLNTNWKNNSNWKTNNASSGENDMSEDGAGGGNWRGGFRGRGFQGRGDRGGFGGRGERGGFGGRGDRGGFGGRGERGGFGGRGGRGGFGGRGRSDREGSSGRWGSEGGFGGRGRGRGGQSGSWNDRRDSDQDGSSDWKMGGENAEGWKGGNGSGSWKQESGDKQPSSWSQGDGSNKQWQSWSSASDGAGAKWGSKGSEQSGSGDWNQESGSKKGGQSWEQGNADKDPPSWNQGGGSNKQWQSGISASGGASDWNSNIPKQAAEGTIAQDGGWSKGPNSNQETGWKTAGSGGDTGDRAPGWGQSSAADNGQSSSWNTSADGAANSWGKKNDESDKGGWQ